MRIKKTLPSIIITALFLFLFTWVGNEVVVKNRGTRADFFAVWYGTHQIIHQASPYSFETTQVIHNTLSGRPLGPGVYAHSFAYPAYLVALLFPFALLPYSIAFSIWTGLQLPMLFAALYLLTRFLETKLSNLELVLLFITGSIGFLYPLVSYALGQTSILQLFLIVLVLFLSKGMKLIAAGIVLTFTAIRPDIFIVTGLATLVIVWNSKQAIKQLMCSTAVSFLAINVFSVLFLGFWYTDWVNMLMDYSVNNPKTYWPLALFPGNILPSIAMFILLVYALWQIVRFVQTPSMDRKLFAISTLFLLHSIIFKITGSYQMTLLLIPAITLLPFYKQRKQHWIIWLMLLTPWLFFGLTGRTDSSYNILLLPLIFLILQVPLLMSSKKKETVTKTA